MIVHFFTKGDMNIASSRHRAFLLAEELNELGIKSVVHWPPTELISKTSWPYKFRLIFAVLLEILKIKKGGIIYLQRTIYNKFFFVFIVFFKLVSGRKMIFDFDDAIYIHSFFKTKTLSRLADAVVVGSRVLADWAKKYNKNVFIVPTCVKFSSYNKYSRLRRPPNKKFTIGWIGNGPAHCENLRMLGPVFEELIKTGFVFKFILVGSLKSQKVYSLFRDIDGLDANFIDSIDWRDPEAMPRIIQNFDVGLMPLVDSEFQRGRCAFKAIEYMACAVPAIVSPVGENNYLVKDGENGFLAGSKEEWIEKIMRLYQDKYLIEKIGKNAEETIAKNYSYEAIAPKFIEIFNKL